MEVSFTKPSSVMDPTASYNHQQTSSTEDQDSVIIPEDNDDVVPLDDESVTNSPGLGIFAHELTVDKLGEGNIDYQILKRSYVGKDINLVGIYKKSYDNSASDVGEKNSCVAANIEYAWYGGSRDEVFQILKHGFPVSDGSGVSLLPATTPIQRVKTSVADSDGLRHVLLCRVILGNHETIPLCSPKGHPSSREFDSGVDNISNPTNYVIGKHNVNTHVLPAFIISFKGCPIEGEQADIQVSRAVSTPTSQLVSFSDLISQLTNHLSASKMAPIKKDLLALSEGKMSKDEFIRCLRANARDDVLERAVRILKSQRKSSSERMSSSKHLVSASDLIRRLTDYFSSLMASIKKLELAYSKKEIPKKDAFVRRLRAIVGEYIFQRAVKKLASQRGSISDLIKHLTDHLSSSVASIKELHLSFSTNKIKKDELVRSLLAIAGEQHLRRAVGKLKQPCDISLV